MDRRSAAHQNRPSLGRRRWRTAAAILLGAALATATPMAAVAAKPAPSPGAPGAGDEYFPLSGNGGYDVRHYGLDLDYEPATDTLQGLAVITAKATQALSAFNLDLAGLDIGSVTVNGRTAAWSRAGDELTITPKSSLPAGATFITTVRYSGVPQPIDDVLGGVSGFLHTDDGALVAGQPFVASTWFPVNDHPIDKALYTVRITVPKGLEAVSNGRLLWHRDTGDSSIWLWNTDEPMASYLATATIGEFDLDAYRADGIRYWDAIDPDLMAPTVVARTGSQFAYSGQADDSYKRLQRTVTVPAAGGELSFSVDRDVEDGWDFAFVEVAPSGTDDWTTLADTGGILQADAGNAACADLLAQHPFLGHYLSEADGGPCLPSGTTGDWWAATGASDGWEQWAFDLSAYAGTDVDVSITYVSDYLFQLDGVAIDDVVVPGGAGSTSFEDDGDAFDGWTVPGAPAGSPGNADDWTVTSDGPPPLGAKAAASLARQPEIVGFLEGYFGDYPFDEAGGIVDDLANLGFALENQTRPIYAKEFFADPAQGDAVVVHELAHQWFGDSVALERWKDIWLNEGFATYAEWLWSEYEGGAVPQDYFDFYLAEIPEDDPFWTLPIGDPGPDDLFDQAVYLRGAMTLHALRMAIGDDVFFELLPAWHAQQQNGNADTAEFIALAEELSGQELDALFETWLYTGERPAEALSNLRSFDAGPTPKLTIPPSVHGN
ncbi:M1 family metallopeptidase [Agromyces humi]|uniref:M1 family metallopeptidase n=1 Tax=Agromyces humi TaxID=1766800 RepID=UPI00193934B3|nr:M1 family metallopeptidase [Agromyces humi]